MLNSELSDVSFCKQQFNGSYTLIIGILEFQ